MKNRAPASAVLCFALAASAQTGHHSTGSKESPALIIPGLGRVNHPIRTRSAEAQQFFNQGLALVYGFNHEEAARSFRRAAELDPASPMPYWGIALAVGPNYNDADIDRAREKAAWDAIQKARQIAASAPAREHDYVEALTKCYSDDPKADLKALARTYRTAMKELSGRYPDDLDAAVLYAASIMDLHPWDLWTQDGKSAEERRSVRP